MDPTSTVTNTVPVGSTTFVVSSETAYTLLLNAFIDLIRDRSDMADPPILMSEKTLLKLVFFSVENIVHLYHDGSGVGAIRLDFECSDKR